MENHSLFLDIVENKLNPIIYENHSNFDTLSQISQIEIVNKYYNEIMYEAYKYNVTKYYIYKWYKKYNLIIDSKITKGG